MQVLGQIDFVGGFLSVSGMLLFMAGLRWGGYQYPWRTAHVLAPLLLGSALLAAFFVWEWVWNSVRFDIPSTLLQRAAIRHSLRIKLLLKTAFPILTTSAEVRQVPHVSRSA